ncbi:MAG: bifunctional 4-hydroxy-2-oxoglutarate aldolase/2-dehydro-3-deoxy-phosphogluconate aldolase, partial [Planctomycetota bacterium]
ACALVEAGVSNMEVTCRISNSLEKLAQLRSELPDFAAGMASLVDEPAMLDIYNKANPDDPLPSVEQAAEAGACYLVSSVNFRDETYEKYAGRIPMIPGCANAGEVVAQFAGGANLCKVFPAKQLGGPGYLKAIDAPLHKMISLVPMGGTNPDNFSDYIDAGALVLGGSFSMIEKQTMAKIVEEQDYDLLTHELTVAKHLIHTVRAEKYPDIDFAVASAEEISRATGRNFNIG